MSKKVQLLVWADYCCNTGFGTVSRNVVTNLINTGDFSVDIVGINYDGDPYDREKWPGNVYPAMRGRMVQGPYMDVFGRQRLLDMLATGKYDVLFMIQDTFVVKDFIQPLVEACDATGTKPVFYYPIDAPPHPSWITDVVSKIAYPITYTNYAHDESVKVDPALKSKLEVIYHGTNTEDFHPLNEVGFRESYFGPLSSKFIMMNINRNQPRKDVLRSLLIQKELKERGENTLLYLHMSPQDVGGDILDWGNQLGLTLNEDYVLPNNFNEGFPLQLVNQLYNAVDCVLTTTHGEGWGLSLTEAMATKTPIVAPDNTSIHEILGDNRGILVPSGVTNHDWFVMGHGDNNRLRPLMNVHAAADAIQDLIQGKQPDIEGAYNWATEQTWEVISKQFEKTIRKAASGRSTVGVVQNGNVIKLNREQRRKLAKSQ